MGYYACWDGCLKVREKPSDEIIKELRDVFDDINFDNEKMEIVLYGYNKYHEEDVENILTEIEPIVASGKIKFVGDDAAHWRYIFKDGHWREESGYVFYDSDIPAVINDREEFLGSIIDVIQDAMDNPEGDIIEGAWYDKIRNELEDRMKAWKVLA